jgi:methylmalonyl-CoA/ethylmalonyl-CoA epimerase
MKIHHLGVAVKSLNKSISHYTESLGWRCITEIIFDPIQNVNIVFMGDENEVLYELIEPVDETSPVFNLLKRRTSLYHFCYEVPDIEAKIKDMSGNGFFLISGPVPAVAFNGRKVAFLINQDNLTIELVEI